MKRFNFSICLLVLIMSSSAFADTTHVGGRVSGRFTIEESPYLVDQASFLSIREGDTLIIDAGVEIFFDQGGGLNCEGVLLAEGTMEDSILFDTFAEGNWPWWESMFLISNETPILSYCVFRNAHSVEGNGEGAPTLFMTGSVIIESCFFDNLYWAIGTYPVEGEEMIIRGCRFVNCRAIVIGGEGCLVERCVFEHGGVFIGMDSPNSIIANCLFYRSGVSSYDNSFNVHQSIFNNSGIRWYSDRRNEDVPNIDYNISHPGPGLSIHGDGEIEDFGILNRINANSDSTDRYGNLIMDPRLVGGDDFPDMFFLQDDSPCIDAGDPETDPDPDGTRADIGPFFFPQQNIFVEPDVIEFIDVQTGDRAEYELEICNIGLLPLEIFTIALRPDNTPFSITEGEDVFEIQPDTSHTLVIGFAPEREDVYETTLLIMSNDRDQGELEIPVTGSALDVADADATFPVDFELFNPRPNPFNRSCRIGFTLPQHGFTTLELIDTQGRKVVELVSGFLPGGSHVKELRLDDCPAGVYLVRLRHEGRDAVRKVVYMK